MAIYKENGKYLVRVNIKMAKGIYKRANRTVATYKEAKTIEKTLLEQQQKNELMKMTYLLDSFISDQKTRMKISSFWLFEHYINKYIRPFFGDYRLCEIQPFHIHRWQLQIVNNLSGSAMRSIELILNRAFNYGVSYYHLRENPFSKIEYIGKPEHKEMKFWTVDEFKKVLAVLNPNDDKDRAFRLILLISFFCCTRIGETLALMKSDIKVKEHMIDVNKTFISRNKKEYMLPPKTPSSVRRIVIPDFLLQELVKYMETLPGDQSRLFPGITHGICLYRLKQVSKIARVKEIRVHDLRHSAVSYLLHLGVPIYDISKRCGHASPRITYQIYSHLYLSDDHITSVLEEAGQTSNKSIASNTK